MSITGGVSTTSTTGVARVDVSAVPVARRPVALVVP